MDDLVERLRAFAAGCRGSMWQSRDETIALCDEAADEITALRARLAEVEKERDELEGANILNRTAIRLQKARAVRAEAALATARRDALEEAATLTVAIEGIGHCQMPVRWRDAIRALIDKDATP